MSELKIGYEQLDADEQIMYELFKQAFVKKKSSVDVGKIDRNVDVMKVLQVVLGDNPDVVYFDKTQIKLTTSFFGGKQIHFMGLYSQAKAGAMSRDLESAVRNAVEKILILNPQTDYERLICIYEYLQDNVRYDEKELAVCSGGKSGNPESHNAYGALVEGLAVCDGIAAAFTLLAKRFGYKCTVVNGKASFRTEGFSSHAWNIIYVGGSYYHMDVTWDINHKQQLEEYSYEYFCVDDNTLETDHEWSRFSAPTCNGNQLSYYRHNHCFANSLSQLDDFFVRYSKSKACVVRIRVSKSVAIPYPEEDYLGKRLLDLAASVGRYAQISYSWNQNTRSFFAKFM